MKLAVFNHQITLFNACDQILLGITIILLIDSSWAVNLINGYGNCLTMSGKLSEVDRNLLVTAPCKVALTQQWEFRMGEAAVIPGRLCNGINFCVMGYDKVALTSLVVWPSLIQGNPSEHWDLTPWSTLVNIEGKCLGSTNITGDPVVTVPCDIKAPGQQWAKKIIVK